MICLQGTEAGDIERIGYLWTDLSSLVPEGIIQGNLSIVFPKSDFETHFETTHAPWFMFSSPVAESGLAAVF